MKYDAITIDTSIFDRNHLNLKSGMLKQLHQFKEGLAQFVLSEIVVREVHKHMIVRAERGKEALKNAIQLCSDSALLSDKLLEELKAIDAGSVSPPAGARAQLEEFMKNSGCTVVRADQGDMKRLIGMYFGPTAPFEDAKDKKSEFPDAIALITLEDWARTNNKKLLAISGDNGWKKFAEKSEWIDVESDLAAALQQLQTDAERAHRIVGDLLQKTVSGQAPELLQELERQVARQVSDLSPEPEASAGYYFDGELTAMTFEEMRLLQDDGDEFDFYIVQIGKDKVVARVAIGIKATAEAHFRFQVHDEGDYIPIGDCDAKQEVEFDAGALVTFEGDFTANPRNVTL